MIIKDASMVTPGEVKKRLITPCHATLPNRSMDYRGDLKSAQLQDLARGQKIT